ncbi:MAG: aminoglycoside 6-adenylyltransferase [Anaerolineae bacterium]|nr:aminoglycoside 6-adenylyltransferase [Anaerolineae bacterium]
MKQTTQAYEQLIARFVAWAETQAGIRAALIVGSRAREDRPADEWSDLDVILLVAEPERYLAKTDWLENIGHPWITFIERTGTGDEKEHRVLFEGGLDVDFIPLPAKKMRSLARLLQTRERFPKTLSLLPRSLSKEAAQGIAAFSEVARRGVKVLVDKDGIAESLLAAITVAPAPNPPTQDKFLNLVNDFWYHAVWTAKKLRRGELWTAKGCSDSYMKWQLLRMIEWHARAKSSFEYDTWHGGRFLERWADPRIVDGLRDAFAHYDEDDLWRGLLATMDLFRWVAVETAELLEHAYPSSADEHATELVKGLSARRLE